MGLVLQLGLWEVAALLPGLLGHPVAGELEDVQRDVFICGGSSLSMKLQVSGFQFNSYSKAELEGVGQVLHEFHKMNSHVVMFCK